MGGLFADIPTVRWAAGGGGSRLAQDRLSDSVSNEKKIKNKQQGFPFSQFLRKRGVGSGLREEAILLEVQGAGPPSAGGKALLNAADRQLFILVEGREKDPYNGVLLLLFSL